MRNLLIAVVACAALLAPARADAGDGKKLLPLLPDDVELVAVLDVADARGAATFDALFDSAPARLADLLAMLVAIGIDARHDVDTVVVAGHDDTYQLVVEGRFTRAQLAKVGAAGAAKKHRGVRYWTSDGGEVALLGKRLVLTSAGEMTGAIDRHKKKGRSLVKSPDAAPIRAAIAMVDPRHDLWLATAGGRLGGADGIDAMTLGATFGADLLLEVRVRVADPDRVAALRQSFEQSLPQVVQVLEQVGLAALAASLAVDWDGQVVDVDATATADELTTLLGLVAMM